MTAIVRIARRVASVVDEMNYAQRKTMELDGRGDSPAWCRVLARAGACPGWRTSYGGYGR